MNDRVDIGHDTRHYEFLRTSGLPRGTFDRKPTLRWRWVLLAAVAVALGLWGTSVAMSDEEINHAMWTQPHGR